MSVGNTNSEITGRQLRIAVIVGSTRPGRRGDAVADWVHRIGARRDDAVFEVLDIAGFGLPLLDEPVPAAIGDYRHPHTLAWSEAVSGFDGYVFAVPEYNHSVPAAVKNAIDLSAWSRALRACRPAVPAGAVTAGSRGGGGGHGR